MLQSCGSHHESTYGNVLSSCVPPSPYPQFCLCGHHGLHRRRCCLQPRARGQACSSRHLQGVPGAHGLPHHVGPGCKQPGLLQPPRPPRSPRKPSGPHPASDRFHHSEGYGVQSPLLSQCPPSPPPCLPLLSCCCIFDAMWHLPPPIYRWKPHGQCTRMSRLSRLGNRQNLVSARTVPARTCVRVISPPCVSLTEYDPCVHLMSMRVRHRSNHHHHHHHRARARAHTHTHPSLKFSAGFVRLRRLRHAVAVEQQPDAFREEAQRARARQGHGHSRPCLKFFCPKRDRNGVLHVIAPPMYTPS